MSSNAVAMEILRWAVRACLPTVGHERPPVDALAAVDWHRMLWLGRQTRGLLFLRHALAEKASSLPYPTDIRVQLQALHDTAQLQCLSRAKELCSLHDLFAAENIPFVAIDDWPFERRFADGRNVTEKMGRIRVAVAPANIERARALLATAGREEFAGPFHVSSPGHMPIALIADDAAQSAPASLPVGSRLLQTFTPSHWLQWLARDAAWRREVDFVHAWQVLLLEAKYGSQTIAVDPRAATGIARCRLACGLGVAADVAPPLPATPTPPAIANLPFAPFVPTSPLVAERMLALAGTRAGDNVFDLGCGDGRILITAAKKFGARGTGIDLDPALIAQARSEAEAEGVSDRTAFVCDDLFSADLSGASIVCLYLLPSFYAPVRERLLTRARPGTRVVSHDYIFPQWAPEHTELVRAEPTRISQISLWRLP